MFKPEHDKDWLKLLDDLTRFIGHNRHFFHLKNDISAESLLRTSRVVREKPAEFPGFENVRKYAHRVARNLVIDLARKEKKHTMLPIHPEVHVDRRPSIRKPKIISHTLDDRIDFEKAMKAVPREFRSTLYLRSQDYSYEDIAAELGISVGTVKSRLSRGLKHLKKALHLGE